MPTPPPASRRLLEQGLLAADIARFLVRFVVVHRAGGAVRRGLLPEGTR